MKRSPVQRAEREDGQCLATKTALSLRINDAEDAADAAFLPVLRALRQSRLAFPRRLHREHAWGKPDDNSV